MIISAINYNVSPNNKLSKNYPAKAKSDSQDVSFGIDSLFDPGLSGKNYAFLGALGLFVCLAVLGVKVFI